VSTRLWCHREHSASALNSERWRGIRGDAEGDFTTTFDRAWRCERCAIPTVLGRGRRTSLRQVIEVSVSHPAVTDVVRWVHVLPPSSVRRCRRSRSTTTSRQCNRATIRRLRIARCHQIAAVRRALTRVAPSLVVSNRGAIPWRRQSWRTRVTRSNSPLAPGPTLGGFTCDTKPVDASNRHMTSPVHPDRRTCTCRPNR